MRKLIVATIASVFVYIAVLVINAIENAMP